MKKLVSALVLGGLVGSVYAWPEANANYFQPTAAYEVLKGADTNSSKDVDKADSHQVESDFKVVTNISGESYSNEGAHASNHDDIRAFKDIMLNDKFYAMLLAVNSEASEHASTAEFVMLMREMRRINHNLELILSQHQKKQGVGS